MACLPLLIAELALVAPPLRADDAIISVPLTVSSPTPRDSIDQLRRGVERGDSGAINNLGIRYHLGDGVAQDYREALRLYRLAAEAPKNKASPTIIGVMYNDGLGVDRDYREALRWYQLAVERGDPLAPRQLADLQRRLRQDHKTSESPAP
jgi:hypothetical protein